jgi:hypothetical protein
MHAHICFLTHEGISAVSSRSLVTCKFFAGLTTRGCRNTETLFALRYSWDSVGFHGFENTPWWPGAIFSCRNLRNSSQEFSCAVYAKKPHGSPTARLQSRAGGDTLDESGGHGAANKGSAAGEAGAPALTDEQVSEGNFQLLWLSGSSKCGKRYSQLSEATLLFNLTLTVQMTNSCTYIVIHTS